LFYVMKIEFRVHLRRRFSSAAADDNDYERGVGEE